MTAIRSAGSSCTPSTGHRPGHACGPLSPGRDGSTSASAAGVTLGLALAIMLATLSACTPGEPVEEQVRTRVAAEQTRVAAAKAPASALATATPSGTGRQSQLSEPAAVARTLPALVRVSTTDSVGTGVIVRSDGLVVTNAHVVGSAQTVSLRLHDGREILGAVLRADAERDLALLQATATGLAAAELGDPAMLHLGEQLIAVGYALDLGGGPTVTKGLFSAYRTSARGVDYVQTDASINPGNSGGPLVSLRGEVVGINAFRLEQRPDRPRVVGISFAISSASVKEFLDSSAR